MSSHRALVVLVALAVVIVVSGCKGNAPEPSRDVQFKARLVMGSPEGADESVVNFTRDRQRVVVGAGGTVVIVRMDKEVSWVLMPTRSLYLERLLEPGNKNPLIYQPDQIDKYERLGDENLDGHPVIKERFVMTNAGSEPMEIYRWFATDIGWPVKAEAVDGSWTLEFKDLVAGPQDPALFEVPQGYSKIQGQQPHTMPPAKKAE
ncbi:MAG: hypothetical protein HZA22_01195 [Nitrospirae bacterium]|nr:hypothetical protein [Nitrospirota bacterium]MBI5696247.1 hypothetical protein [Nitrospirota bacterium]